MFAKQIINTLNNFNVTPHDVLNDQIALVKVLTESLEQLSDKEFKRCLLDAYKESRRSNLFLTYCKAYRESILTLSKQSKYREYYILDKFNILFGRMQKIYRHLYSHFALRPDPSPSELVFLSVESAGYKFYTDINYYRFIAPHEYVSALRHFIKSGRTFCEASNVCYVALNEYCENYFVFSQTIFALKLPQDLKKRIFEHLNIPVNYCDLKIISSIKQDRINALASLYQKLTPPIQYDSFFLDNIQSHRTIISKSYIKHALVLKEFTGACDIYSINHISSRSDIGITERLIGLALFRGLLYSASILSRLDLTRVYYPLCLLTTAYSICSETKQASNIKLDTVLDILLLTALSVVCDVISAGL